MSAEGKPAVVRLGRYFLLFVLIAFALLGSSGAIYFVVLRTRDALSGTVVETLIVFLLAFLLILVARYLLLLWFSWLQQLEERGTGKDTDLPFVSIIVPAYNEAKVIDASVASLLRLRYPAYEVIIVDDGSTDETFGRARGWEGEHGPCRVLAFSTANNGKAAALNYGIARASGEIVACIDSDSRLDPDSIAMAARHFAEPRIGAVAGNVKVSNRGTLLGRLQALEYIEGLNLVRKAQAYFRTVNIIPGPLGLFRRHVLDEVGGYEGDTFAEDCDLTLRILRGGWHVTYEPLAVAWTEAPERLGDLLRQRYRWTRGILQALWKQRSIFRPPWRDLTVPAVTGYMVFEGIVWPVVNLTANTMLIYVGAVYGFSSLLVLWWVQLTLLDVAMALHCSVMEKEDLSLVGYAVIYRLVFILLIDIYKVYAMVEQALGLRMAWGKLSRLGKI